MPIPDKIANAPDLGWGLDFYYTAFMELSTCRDLGMAEGAIPWTAVREFAEADGLLSDPDEFERFVTIIRGLDIAYLEHQKSKQKKDQKSGHIDAGTSSKVPRQSPRRR